jgi:hypothetical protein
LTFNSTLKQFFLESILLQDGYFATQLGFGKSSLALSIRNKLEDGQFVSNW